MPPPFGVPLGVPPDLLALSHNPTPNAALAAFPAHGTGALESRKLLRKVSGMTGGEGGIRTHAHLAYQAFFLTVPLCVPPESLKVNRWSIVSLIRCILESSTGT
jgi:hypothetical protein